MLKQHETSICQLSCSISSIIPLFTGGRFNYILKFKNSFNIYFFFFSSKKRNRKKKNQVVNASSENSTVTDLVAQNGETPGACNIPIKEIQMALEAFELQYKPAKTHEEAMQKSYQFWNTQPVPKMGKLK